MIPRNHGVNSAGTLSHARIGEAHWPYSCSTVTLQDIGKKISTSKGQAALCMIHQRSTAGAMSLEEDSVNHIFVTQGFHNIRCEAEASFTHMIARKDSQFLVQHG